MRAVLDAGARAAGADLVTRNAVFRSDSAQFGFQKDGLRALEAAAIAYGAVVKKYRSVLLAPRIVAWLLSGLRRRRKARYDAAFEALMCAGQRPAKAVARHLRGHAPVDGAALALGLDALARHFAGHGTRSYSEAEWAMRQAMKEM